MFIIRIYSLDLPERRSVRDSKQSDTIVFSSFIDFPFHIDTNSASAFVQQCKFWSKIKLKTKNRIISHHLVPCVTILGKNLDSIRGT